MTNANSFQSWLKSKNEIFFSTAPNQWIKMKSKRSFQLTMWILYKNKEMELDSGSSWTGVVQRMYSRDPLILGGNKVNCIQWHQSQKLVKTNIMRTIIARRLIL